ncbi:MAG: MATE family efflux transporter [Thermodesulfovibrionales bacterium]|nr:MATE family efflux transporter [Thermodesulfovibrionales bacterium]
MSIVPAMTDVLNIAIIISQTVKISHMDKSFTRGNIWLSIYRMSLPMLVIMFSHFLLGIVEIYAAGRLGYEVQSAVGFVMQICFVLLILANAVSIGTLSIISKAVGAGDYNRALVFANQSLIIGLGLALLIPSLILPFSTDIVIIAGFPNEIRDIAINLLNIHSFAIANAYMLIISTAIFRASGEVRRSLFVMVITNLLNVFLIFPLTFGIEGVFSGLNYRGLAYSLLIATFCGFMICLYFFTDKNWRSIYTMPITVCWENIREVLHISWPSGLMQFAWHAGTVFLMNILGRLETAGVTAIAAMTNGLRIESIIYLPAFALNMSASVLIGQNLGANQPKRAEQIGWMLALTGVAVVSVLSLIIFLSSHEIVGILTDNNDVRSETIRYLYFNLAIEPFMAVGVILAGGLQGAGDTKGVMRIIISCMWLIRIPLAYILAIYFMMGALGVWIAMIVSMCFQGIFMALRFKKGKWKGLK